jgi:hypothetical protein
MKLLNELWNDETGSVVSAELVLLGTLGVVGVGVGAAAIGDTADAEMEEVAYSIRSVDQSYGVGGFHGCGAWTAGSFYRQPPVEESRAALREQIRRERAALEDRLREEEGARDGDQRVREREEELQKEERLERRRRMREREREQPREGRGERWDGDERPEREAPQDREATSQR